MSAKEFNCPKCGGVIQIGPGDTVNTHCPFCNSLVAIPPEFRPRESSDMRDFTTENFDYPAAGKRVRTIIILSVIGVLLLAGGTLALIFILASKGGEQAAIPTISTAAATATEAATITPTPPYAFSVLTFGGSGIGEGLFNNPRYIAIDGQGNIYVADYDNGRVQRFSQDGTYQGSWSTTEDGSHIYGLAATFTGNVFVSVGGEIKKYDGPTGEWLATIPSDGGEYGELAATLDGGVVAVWYEGRWGLITSLEGHREALVIFDADGNQLQYSYAFISDITGNAAYDVYLAVDGNNMIYAACNSYIFVFNKQGQYIDRFGPSEDEPGAMNWVDGIAVDGQGRIYALESYSIHVYSTSYSFVDDIRLDSSFNAITVDDQNNIWLVADDKVEELQLRQ